MEHSATGYFVPIACRFVPYDQWLVTHLHTTWKIADVKLWLLAKLFPTLFTSAPSVPHQRRSRRQKVSPIRFARREEVSDDEQPPADDAYEDTDYFSPLSGLDDDDEPLLSDKFAFIPRKSSAASTSDIIPKVNSPSPHVDPSNYVLLSYSTTQILEDGWQFGWYTVHPHELLELHTYPYVVKLPRSSVREYCEPYFEGSAWVLQVVDDLGTGRSGELTDLERERLRKRRRYASWHHRWIVIYDGYFHIFKDRQDSSLQYRARLNSLIGIRGADFLKKVRETTSDSFSGPREELSNERLLCVNFPNEALQPDNLNWFRRGSRDATASEESRKYSSSNLDHGNADDEADESRAGDAIAFCLVMQDDAAFNHILRILHRSNFPAPTSFFSHVGIRRHSPHRPRAYSPLAFASPSPSPERSPSASSDFMTPPRTPTPTSSSVKYPEWRWDLVHKAKRSGLGDVGRAMELARFGEDENPDDMFSDYDDNMPEEQPPRGRTMTNKWGVVLDDDSGGTNSDDESECEWEEWKVDYSSNRARRPLPYRGDDTHALPSVDYSFPPHRNDRTPRKLITSPRRSLTHYASADSLRQYLPRMNSIRRDPGQTTERAESPSPGLGRSRARSPLAERDFDYSNVVEVLDMEPGLAVTSPQQFLPDAPYPCGRTSHESKSNSGPVNPARMNAVPYSMAMTTLTSQVTAGNPGPSKKGKGKGKDKASGDAPTKMSRNRSLTVQGPSRPSTVESAHESLGTSSQGTLDASPEKPSKPGRMKLGLSFAQVAQNMAASSARALAPPSSATTASSFESPVFTRPEDSD